MIDFLRIAKEDDALPLSRPIVGLSGKVYNEILVPKETLMTISLMGYNLYANPPDPHESLSLRLAFPFTGTRIFGARTPMNSDQSDGSTRRTISSNPLSAFIATCA